MEPNSQNHDRAHLRLGRDRNNLKLCKILFKNMISLEKITGGALKLLHMCLRRKNPTRIKNTDKNKHDSTLQEVFSSFSRVAHHSQSMLGALVSLALCSFLPVSSSSAPRTEAKVFGLRTLDAAQCCKHILTVFTLGEEAGRSKGWSC